MDDTSISFLQGNLNHCAASQNLFFQSVAQWSIHVSVICEPYRIVPGWLGDLDDLVALISRTSAGAPPLTRPERGRGFVSAFVGDIMVVGGYFSPSRSLAEFEQYLLEVGALIDRVNPPLLLVCGDFNAKSTAWGSPQTLPRGETLEDWALERGLMVLNRGEADTCVRRQGGSKIDVSFASAALASRIRGWHVAEYSETLSDHRYIRFSVSAAAVAPAAVPRSGSGDCPRWALKKLDRELLVEAALVETWVSGSSMVDPMDVEGETLALAGAMTRICDASMPRARPFSPRRAVYWWDAELAHLRQECVGARRQYARHRRRRRRDAAEEDRLYAVYRDLIDALKLGICKAKDQSRKELLESLNSDPWGRPYRLVRRKLRPWAPPLTESLRPELLEQTVEALFPHRAPHVPPPMAPPSASTARETGDAEDTSPEVTAGELGAAVLRLRAKNAAPGLDGVPGRVWVMSMDILEEKVRALFSASLAQGRFPRLWKTGKLVLLHKEGRPEDSPSAYRPIVLLDEACKLFERVIAARLVKHLTRVGPDLSDEQYGFRCGRSTLDAIARVRAQAEETVARGEVLLAVSLDITNAFNTLPWACITEALKYHAVPQYLQRIVANYLSDRSVRYPTRGGWSEAVMTCGVPQGSVLGPLLWNIGFDWVLRGSNLRGVGLVCYADDTLVTARGRTYRDAAILATAGVAHVVGRIRRLGLEVALNKSEALCFHGPRMAPPAHASLIVGGTSVAVGGTMKYLGLVLDSRWNFHAHFKRLVPKLMGAVSALGGLLPNIGGPEASCRRLYTGVVRSMALYGAPIWAKDLDRHNLALLRRPQRVMAIRVCRAYRTVSYEAACLLAGTPPWDLDAEVLAEVHDRRVASLAGEQRLAPEELRRWRELLRDGLLRRWNERLGEQRLSQHWTVQAILPVFREWIERRWGPLTYHLSQVLSGHGCFGEYLWRVAKREPRPECHHCVGAIDTARHTLEDCPAWAEPRRQLSVIVGGNVSLPAVVASMVDSEASWKTVMTFCEEVISQKEAAERAREEDPLADPLRRRRVGRRRQAHNRRPP